MLHKWPILVTLLAELHWLPVRCRIEYKMAVLCYNAVRQEQPLYLASSLWQYAPLRSLRSSSAELLHIPKHKTVLGSLRFSVAVPRIWNNLPLIARTVNNFTSFKSVLKTHLFAISRTNSFTPSASDYCFGWMLVLYQIFLYITLLSNLAYINSVHYFMQATWMFGCSAIWLILSMYTVSGMTHWMLSLHMCVL